ncbi:MAG: hypothetical protein AAF961_01605, partial [Planctomycetota bacterium]
AVTPVRPPLNAALTLALAVCAFAVGCCSCCPRIDPSGRRCLIWPGSESARVPPPATRTGNIAAPPVYTDPFFPAAAAPVASPPAPSVSAPPPNLQAPAVTSATPTNLTSASPASTRRTQGDQVVISPQRVLAPVGSEVVLKSGLCAREGYLVTKQKIEWMLGRNGVGQFVELGSKGWLHPPWMPWNKSEKIDNYYAVGYTSKKPRCITRGNDDPSDDVEIRAGDAWVSVISPVEGTSHVTAFTPQVESWGSRRATATIYWIDAQWAFPDSSITSSGRPTTLTTTVTRQTDGTPLEGWIVRYEVNDGGGSLTGSASGQVVEVRTGPDGRASVDVSPTDVGAPTSRIDMQLVRPAGFRGGDMPRLEVANGTTTITWTGDTGPYLPAETAAPLESSGPPPMAPPAAVPPTTAPPPSPVLEVEVYQIGPEQPQVGGTAQFGVVIRNTGDATATGVVLNVRFDKGLSHQQDPGRELEIKTEAPGNIAPSAQWQTKVPLTFNVISPEEHCLTVRASSYETTSPERKACITAVAAPPQHEPGRQVRKDRPRQAEQNETIQFTVVVKNTGETPLKNIEVVDEYPPTLRPIPKGSDYVVQEGRIIWRINQLSVGQDAQFEVEYVCLSPTLNATSVIRASAQTEDGSVILSADDHTLEILPARAAPPVGPDTDTQPRAEPLGLSFDFFGNPVLRGATTTCQVVVTNRSGQEVKDVEVAIVFPSEMTPVLDDVQTPPTVEAELLPRNILRFSPVRGLRAGDEPLRYTVRVNTTQPGIVTATAGVLGSLGDKQLAPIERSVEVEIRR